MAKKDGRLTAILVIMIVAYVIGVILIMLMSINFSCLIFGYFFIIIGSIMAYAYSYEQKRIKEETRQRSYEEMIKLSEFTIKNETNKNIKEMMKEQQKFCTYCGVKNNPEDKFCAGCGHKVQ